MAFVSVRATESCPIRSGKVRGRHLRGRERCMLTKCGRRRWAQVDLRRTGAPPDRCFLPDLTRFRGFRRTGPEPISGGRGAILSESRAARAREHERCEERDAAGEAGHEIDALK